jgi:chromosome segregation ATPase
MLSVAQVEAALSELRSAIAELGASMVQGFRDLRDAVEVKIEGESRKFASLVESHSEDIRAVAEGYEALDARVTTMQGQMTTMQGQMTTMQGQMTTMQGKMTAMIERQDVFEQKLDGLRSQRRRRRR